MNNGLRILISCVTAIVVLVICSLIVVFVGIEGSTIVYMINAAIAFTAGKYLNTFLKKKYPPKGQKKDDEY